MEEETKTNPSLRRGVIKRRSTYRIPVSDNLSLRAKPTANAWWRQESRVRLLLSAFQEGLKIREARKQANISIRQYKYFARVHPEISDIRKYYKTRIIEEAEKTIAQAVKTDKKFALRYLMKTKPEEFPPSHLLERIKRIEQEHKEEIEGFLEELRELKIIISMYLEVANDLKPSVGGWYKKGIEYAEAKVKQYNRLHKKNNERIRRHRD